MILSILKEKKFRKPKSRRKYLIEQLDKIMSIRVRTRDGYQCQRCGHTPMNKGDVAHHHLFTKTRLSTRWILENGVTLDFKCHRWAHSAGEEFREWARKRMGAKAYDALYLRSQMRASFKECDLEWLLRDMKGAL